MRHRDIPAQLPLFLFILPVLFFASGCGEKLPPADDYPHFIRKSTELMCGKMLQCYEKLYRTVSVEMRGEITVENCMSHGLDNLDEKLKRHTPQMKLLSVKCYESLLETPCNKFAEASMFNQECAMLRNASIKAYAENPFP